MPSSRSPAGDCWFHDTLEVKREPESFGVCFGALLMDPLNGNEPTGLSWLSSFRRTCSLEPQSMSLGRPGTFAAQGWLVMGFSWAGSCVDLLPGESTGHT